MRLGGRDVAGLMLVGDMYGAETIHTHLLDKIPRLAANLDRLPERIQAALIQAFDIQCLYKDDMNQVSVFATITTSTPQAVAAILNDAGSDPANTTPQPQPAPPSSPPIYPSAQPPIRHFFHPDHGKAVQHADQCLAE